MLIKFLLLLLFVVNISELMEKSDLSLANGIHKKPGYPLFNLLPHFKKSSLHVHLRNSGRLLPRLNTERYKSSFSNRLHFQYQFVL